MHESIIRFVSKVLYPQEVYGKDVIEVGSLNTSGTIRPLIDHYSPNSYLGIDLAKGPGVDLVCDVRSVPAEMCAHTVFSCEMLEYTEEWVDVFAATARLAAETLILTCRSPGVPGRGPSDRWRFLPDDIERAVLSVGMHICVCMPDPELPGVLLKAVRPGFMNVQRAPKKNVD